MIMMNNLFFDLVNTHMEEIIVVVFGIQNDSESVVVVGELGLKTFVDFSNFAKDFGLSSSRSAVENGIEQMLRGSCCCTVVAVGIVEMVLVRYCQMKMILVVVEHCYSEFVVVVENSNFDKKNIVVESYYCWSSCDKKKQTI